MKRLKQIVYLRSGYTMRRTPAGAIKRPYPMFQIKDVKDSGHIRTDQIRSAALPMLNPRFLLRKGEVLFCARGVRNFAAVYEGVPKEAVAGSQFFVLEIRVSDVNPHYLAWYINQTQAQNHFAEHRTGSRIPTVNKSDLENLPVPVPAPEVQEKIVELAALARRERELTLEWLQQKEAWLQAGCLHVAAGAGT